ncbi:MAG: MarR family transcriptional regulator [Geminicoccaceae bacterium]|nr:MarR family transcriptional regulator [Geminicoccaceae bacterium]
MMDATRTAEGAALTDLFLAAFPFQGALMAAGERLAGGVGLTAARWQVLSVVARAGRPETVANVARIMGLARQSVQRTANELEKAGLVAFGPNPHHRRASLVHLTDEGQGAFDAIDAAQVPWANALAEGLDGGDIAAAARLLRTLRGRLEGEGPASYAPTGANVPSGPRTVRRPE